MQGQWLHPPTPQISDTESWFIAPPASSDVSKLRKSVTSVLVVNKTPISFSLSQLHQILMANFVLFTWKLENTEYMISD